MSSYYNPGTTILAPLPGARRFVWAAALPNRFQLTGLRLTRPTKLLQGAVRSCDYKITSGKLENLNLSSVPIVHYGQKINQRCGATTLMLISALRLK
jgi:hypothetical protein